MYLIKDQSLEHTKTSTIQYQKPKSKMGQGLEQTIFQKDTGIANKQMKTMINITNH